MNTLKTTLQYPINQERVFNLSVHQEGKDFNFQGFRMEGGKPMPCKSRTGSTVLSNSIRTYHNIQAQATMKIESCDKKKLGELTGFEQFKEQSISNNQSPIFKYQALSPYLSLDDKQNTNGSMSKQKSILKTTQKNMNNKNKVIIHDDIDRDSFEDNIQSVEMDYEDTKTNIQKQFQFYSTRSNLTERSKFGA